MQQLYRIATWFARRRAAAKAAQERIWQRDPLSHPALSRMSPHQLADLPLERTLFDEGITRPTSTIVVPLIRARPRPLGRTCALGQSC